MSSKTVLISGVGIGGPTLAYWLNRAGFETTLVERAPRLRTGGYAIDFWGRGYTVAERMGLLDDINRVGYHIREMRIVNVKGERISGFGTSVFRKLTAGNYVTIGRSELSRLLVETIVNDTEIIFDDEIIGLQELPDCVQVTFKRGGERRFSFVVGADGLHSAVRRLMFGAQGQLTNSNRSFGQGVAGYARYAATSYADFVIGDYMTEAIYPTLLHQDPRYFRRGRGSGWTRFGYALGQIFWTHNDSGRTQFNYSEIVGNSTAVAISNAYYQDSRTARDAAGKLGIQLGVDAASNVLKEFWPDIKRTLQHRRPETDH